MFDRRTFLQAALTAVASLFLPGFLAARGKPRSCWFLHTPTGDSWDVADPVSWSLENARQPVLERASEGLSKLTASDTTRIVRLVVRRCRLNLLEIRPGRVVVHHWGQQGQADLRPFFEQHGLARKGVKVVLLDRKREASTIRHGDDFLFGDRLPPFWPWTVYWKKWQRRDQEERDDWTAAPGTWSGYAGDGIEDNCIPWAALKSAWRRTAAPPCLNCGGQTLLTNFGFPWRGMFNRYPLFVHVCGNCRRSFRDESVKDVGGWLTTNLDAEVRPDFVMMWGRRVKWEPKA
jgi:hypothetical protein